MNPKKPKKLVKTVGITVGVLVLCGIGTLAMGWAWFAWQVYHPQLLITVSTGPEVSEPALNGQPMKLVSDSEFVLRSGEVTSLLMYEGRAQPGIVTMTFHANGEPIQLKIRGERTNRDFDNWRDLWIWVRETSLNIDEPRAVPFEPGTILEVGSVVAVGDLIIYVDLD